MAQVTLKQGDTTPEFEAALDLSRELTDGASVQFYMEHDDSGDLIVNQPATGTQYNPPRATYDFSDGETSRLGTHYAEVVVTYADGEVETTPADGFFEVSITEPTAREVDPADTDKKDITVGVVDADTVIAPALQAVETLAGPLTDGQAVSTLAGDNLSIDAGGALNASSDANQLSDEEVQDIVGAFVTGAGATSFDRHRHRYATVRRGRS